MGVLSGPPGPRKRYGKAGLGGGRPLVRASAEYMGAEYRGGSHVKYTWPCGHWRILELRGGPRGHVKPVAPEMVKKLAHYWGPLPSGGVSCPPCATCDRKKSERGMGLALLGRPRPPGSRRN